MTIDPGEKDVTVPGGTAAGEIGGLYVEFVLPGAGAFGRDKSVAFREASHAKVRYAKDGERVEGKVVLLSEAVALIDQATSDGQAAAARQSAARAAQDAEMAEVRRKVENLTCLVCGGQQFDRQTAREDSQWGATSHRMSLLICTRCSYVMQFSLGQSMFVPGGG